MRLSEEDYRLSMRASRKRKNPQEEPDGLRSLLVHRLRRSAKAVLRMRLSENIETSNSYGVLCEPCKRWTYTEGAGEEVECPHCGRVYVLEFAVFSCISSVEGMQS